MSVTTLDSRANPEPHKLYIAGDLPASLALLVFAQQAFNLNFSSSSSRGARPFFFYTLSTFIFLVLLIFGFVLLRTW